MPKGTGAYSDGSVLLEAEAPPDAIIFATALHINDYAEDEYVVDRRRLRNVRVLERFTRAPSVVSRGSPRPGPLTAIADR